MSIQRNATPVAFVNVSDRERGLAFYRDTLGLKLRSSDGFGDFLELGSALMRLTALPGYQAGMHPVLGWNVDDLGPAMAALREAGIVFTVYEGMGQDADGIWTAPDKSCRLAWFADPDGNVLSLAET